MHILSAEQFTPEHIQILAEGADDFRLRDEAGIESRRELLDLHAGRYAVSLFYEPSTRTRVSFGLAATKLGIGLSETENAKEFSSAIKGESIEDTVRVLNEYGLDFIIMRHDETGAADRAATVSEVPIINAGDGKGEHPTQALLDVYTILNSVGRLGNLNIVMGGDLLNGRTVRSLAIVLSKFPGNKFTFVSIPELQMKDDIKAKLDEKGLEHQDTIEVYDAVRDADIVYWTRLQKERLEHPEQIPQGGLTIDEGVLQAMNAKAKILHPLPRVDEITTDVDSDPRAIYFRQAGNGMYVRMALLDAILKGKLK